MKTKENKTKSRYTKEFQYSMVKLVAESHEPISKIATDKKPYIDESSKNSIR